MCLYISLRNAYVQRWTCMTLSHQNMCTKGKKCKQTLLQSTWKYFTHTLSLSLSSFIDISTKAGFLRQERRHGASVNISFLWEINVCIKLNSCAVPAARVAEVISSQSSLSEFGVIWDRNPQTIFTHPKSALELSGLRHSTLRREAWGVSEERGPKQCC